MLGLHILDWIILAIYFSTVAYLGIYLGAKKTKSLGDFFIAGGTWKKLPAFLFNFSSSLAGAEAVVEGCDTNGCEYMTGGTVIILGRVGENFAAGMTGGMAFIYDLNNEFKNYVNPSSVIWQVPETNYWKNYLKNLIMEHFQETKSKIAQKILENFEEENKNFKQICPKEMLGKLINPLSLKNNISKAV